MPTKVSVKWNRELYSDVEVPMSEENQFETLRAQCFALTGVSVERQKLMCKGKIIKNDDDVKKIKNGCKIILMGSAEILPNAPLKKVVFEEDLTEVQKATMGTEELPPGLLNLGNTCYLNSAINCLGAIPELRRNLIDYASRFDSSIFGCSSGTQVNDVTQSLGNLCQQLDTSVDAVAPRTFLIAFQRAFPQFKQYGPHGVPMQQDADESLSQLLYVLGDNLKKFAHEDSVGNFTGLNSLLKGSMQSTIKCDEDETIPPQVIENEFNKLRCHISIDTNYLSDGIKHALQEKLEKHSDKLGRNAWHSKTDRISKLPPYLTIQFVRFFWKKDTSKKAKILRKVIFPHRLDIRDMCSDNLKGVIDSYRDEVGKAAEAAAEVAVKAEMVEDKAIAESMATNSVAQETSSENNSMDVDEKEAEQTPKLQKQSNPLMLLHTGMYELFAVITHKGRAADSGHYIGWTKGKRENEWFKHDDDKVTRQVDSDIMALTGGGDWHMAYVCFYRACEWLP